MGFCIALLVCAMAAVAYGTSEPVVLPAACPLTGCNAETCEFGLKKDDNGCITCDCNVEGEASKCQKDYANGKKSNMLGKKLLKCDRSGDYLAHQMWENHHACVTKTGELATNWIPSNEGGSDLQCACPVERKTAEAGEGGLPAPPGRFIPQCAESGHYASKQCHGSTGHCWCVDKMSGAQKGEKVGPGQPQPECE